MIEESFHARDRRLQIAVFGSRTQTAGKRRDLSVQELFEHLAVHKEREKKDGAGWSPAVYRDGDVQRCDDNVEAVECLVMDIDDGTPLEVYRPRLQPYK